MLQFLETEFSPLHRHEICYELGQLKDKSALEKLHQVLQNQEEEIVVRHEAAEACGAIGSETSLPILEKFWEREDTNQVLKETCGLAI